MSEAAPETDCIVFSRDMLDDEYAVNFERPWIVQLPNGQALSFDTEKEACFYQRVYRATRHLNPLTGEPEAAA